MELQVRQYGDPCLREVSKEVDSIGPAERMIFQAMIKTMKESKGIGLAAPQVGINRRFFVADVGDGPIVFVNPKIVKTKDEAEMEEGCLSIPNVNIKVIRPYEIEVEYMDEDGDQQKITCKDLLARVILHENDHLDGKLITDYATRKELKKHQSILQRLESTR